MTRNRFTVGFIILSGATIIALDYFGKSEWLLKFSVVAILAAFYAGQYSARFPKN